MSITAANTSAETIPSSPRLLLKLLLQKQVPRGFFEFFTDAGVDLGLRPHNTGICVTCQKCVVRRQGKKCIK